MLWNLIKRHHLICFFAFSILFSFFFSFGISSNSFATSVNCTVPTLENSTQAFSCDTSSLDDEAVWHYRVSSSWTSSSLIQPTISLCISGRSNNGIYSPDCSGAIGFTIYTAGSRTFNFSDFGQIYPYNYRYNSFVFRDYGNFSNFTSHFTISSLTITDIDPFNVSCPECEVCQVCPEIPENPYDTKLDNITKAVYTCGAVLIMLYFFFCIYQIIIKHGGSK